MEQLILKAVVAEFLRTGVEEAQFGRVIDQFVSLCTFEGKHCPVTSVTGITSERHVGYSHNTRHA